MTGSVELPETGSPASAAEAEEALAAVARTRRGWWRAALGVVCAGGALAVVAVADRSLLGETGTALRTLNWAWLPLAAFAEFSSLTAFARAQRRLLRHGGLQLDLRSAMAITYAGNAISLSVPIAGGGAGTVFSFRQFRKLGATWAATGWALALSGLLSTAAFALILAGGAISADHGAALLFGLAGAGLLVIPMVVFGVAVRSDPVRRRLGVLGGRCLDQAGRLGLRAAPHWRPAVDSVLEAVAGIAMRRVHYLVVFGYLLWNWIGDVLCLTVAIRATGAAIPWHGLLLAYCAAAGAALIPLTPGGVGFVETALTAALVAAGMRGSHAIAAVLVYRIFSYWLVIATGWTIFAVTRTRRPARS